MTDSLPLVSVIVPTRNSARFLPLCLESINGQDYPNIELIVVDRDSSDSTIPIAQSYGAKILTKGPERSAQINYGAANALGEYLFRVDSDFRLDLTVVSECVDLAARGADAVVVHNTADEVGFLSKIRKFEVDMYKFSLDHSAARFVSTSVFNTIGGYNETLIAGEDYDFQNRLTASGFKTAFCIAEATHLDEPVSIYPLLVKYFKYGQDFPKFVEQNPNQSKTQLAFFRRDFIKNWRIILSRPALSLGLIGYHILKYAAGSLGYGLASMSTRSAIKSFIKRKSSNGFSTK